MKIKFTLLISIFILLVSCKEHVNVPYKTVEVSSENKIVDLPVKSNSTYDTINDIILKRIDNWNTGTSVMDYVYAYNNVITYARKEQWEQLKQISYKEYILKKIIQKPDTTNLPRKIHGQIKIDNGFLVKDDSSNASLCHYYPYGYFYDRTIFVFIAQDYTRSTYFAYSFADKDCDTLLAQPIQRKKYLVCYDDELVTDSNHLMKIFINDGGKLHLVHSFSTKYLFGISPEEMILLNDSTVQMKEKTANDSYNYWEYKFFSKD